MKTDQPKISRWNSLFIYISILSLLVQSAPLFVPSAHATGATADAEKLAQASQLAGAVEVPSKRNATTKIFETTSGRGWAEIHGESIHYQDGQGAWQPINNNLTTSSGDYAYQNMANRFTSKFKSSLSSNFFNFSQNGQQISFTLQDANSSTAVTSGNSISYPGALDNIDLKYVVLPDGVKSLLTLNNEPSSRTVTFTLTISSGLQVALANGEVKVTDQDDNVFWLMAKPSTLQPIIRELIFTDYSLNQINSTTYNVSFTIPDSFLPNPEMGYPVVIDPSIEIRNEQNNASNMVVEDDPTTTYQSSYNNSVLPVGHTSLGEGRSFLKYDISGIPASSTIDGATFSITTQEERASISRVKIYKVTQDWNPQSLNWNNQPSVNSPFDDSYATNVTYAWWNFDITNTLKSWYTGSSPNYGLTLRAYDPNVSRRNFFSKYYCDPNGPNCNLEFTPYILAYYHTGNAPTPPAMLGSKSWWRTVNTPLAYGDAAVNVANGNLTLNFNDVSVQDQGLDVAVSHTYNSQDNYDDRYGYGWTTSANKRLIPSTDKKTVVYIDETGTSFTFKDTDGNGNYVDTPYYDSSGFYRKPDHRPNGLTWGLKYDPVSDHFIAKSSSAMTYTFASDGKILEEKDRNNNKTTYQYSSGKLVSLTGNSGRKVDISYDGSDKLAKVEDYNSDDPSFEGVNDGFTSFVYQNGDLKTFKYQKVGQFEAVAAITFNYTNHRLDSIIDARGNTTAFTYDGSNRVTDIYDAESKHTKIEYLSSGLTRVTSPKYFSEGGDVDKFITDYYYRTNPYFQTGLVFREVSPKLKNNQNQEVRNASEFDYNDDFLLHATTDQVGAVDASAYDDVSGLLFYQYDENHILALKNYYSPSNYDSGDWRLVANLNGNGSQTLFNYDANGNLIRKATIDGVGINHLLNPDYESSQRNPAAFDPWCIGGVNKTGVADFWCGSGTAGDRRNWAVDNTTAADGQQSQRVGITNAQQANHSVNAFHEIDEPLRLIPNTQYTLSWKYKQDNSNLIVEIVLQYFDDRGQLIRQVNAPTSSYASDWQSASYTFTPTDANLWSTNVYMRAKSANANSTGKVWFDSIRLEQGPTASQQTEKATSFTYTDTLHPNPTGLPLMEITPEGKTNKYNWDNQGNLLKTTDSLNKDTTFTYDPNGNKLSKVEPNGNATPLDSSDYKFTYTYDTRGRIKSVTETQTGRTTSYTYDPNGNLTETVTPNNLKTTYTYDKVNRSQETTNPYSYASKVEYDAQGNPIGITDPNSRKSGATYDANDRLGQETSPTQQTTNYSYDNTDNLKKVEENNKSLQYNYDASGRLISETNNQLGSDKTVQYQYDNAGNLTVINNQTGETINHIYSATDEVTKVTIGGQTTTYTRNKNNQLTKLEKPNGDVAEYFYDDNARVTQIKNSRSSNEFLKYEYQYDANGNRTQIKTTVNAGSPAIVDYEYDNLNQLKKIITSSKTTTYSYDAGGNITTISDTTGALTTYTYDGNRLIKKVISGSGGTTEYLGYDGSGNLTSRDTGDKVDFLAHFNNSLNNARDNQAGKTENSNTNYTPVYETGKFNQALQLDSQTYASFSSSSNINVDSGTVEMWVKPHWNNNSNVKVFFDYYVDSNSIIRLQKTAGNNLQLYYVKNGNNFTVTAMNATTWTNGNWYHLAASWSGTTAKLYVNGQNLTVVSQVYDCDEEVPCEYSWVQTGRSPKIGFGATTETTPASYADVSLDEARLSSYVRSNSEISSSYNATQEFTLPNTTIYEYDSHDYLTKISKPNGTVFGYTYDSNKRRTKRTKTGGNDINYQYDGNKLVAELNNDGTLINGYRYDSQGQLLSIKRRVNDQDIFYYPIADGLGSINQLRSADGSIINSYSYDEWGKLLDKTEQFSLPIRYAGYWYDDDAGMYHLGARWYDPSLNRFVLVDPHPGDQDDSVSLNEYIYVRNNPLIYADADGDFPILAIAFMAWSAYDLYKTYKNPNRTKTDITLAWLGVLPGGKGGKITQKLSKPARQIAAKVAAKLTFSGLIKNFNANKANYRLLSALTEKATGKQYKGGVSVQEVYQNLQTGQTIVKHTIYRAGKILHQHFRPYAQ